MRNFLLFILVLSCLMYFILSRKHNDKHSHMQMQNYTPANSSNNSKDWSQVQKIFGQKGVQEGNAIRINFARTDLKEKINDIPIDPNLTLVGYASFTPMHDHTMMMCTMVLLQSEVEPVVKKLIANNIDIAGMHNHLCGENPKIMFLHCSAHGDAIKLAKGFKSALDLTKTPLGTNETYQKSDINWQNVESILGLKGKKQGTLILFNVPRSDKIYDMDTEIPTIMGVGETINIQKIGDKAVSIGDFVVTANEVNPVLKALTRNGIRVTSIHNHMLDENPRTFCLHYWIYDKPEKIAKGLRSALNEINIIKAY